MKILEGIVEKRLRFPEELLPNESSRKLMETLGVEIVAGDEELIAACQAEQERQAAEQARYESERTIRRRRKREELRGGLDVRE